METHVVIVSSTRVVLIWLQPSSKRASSQPTSLHHLFHQSSFFCSPFRNCPSSPHRTPKFPTSRHHFNPTATFKALPSSKMTRSTPLSPANISPLREKRRVERPPTSYSAVQQSRIQSTSRSVPPHQHPNRCTPRARGQSTASTCHPYIF